MEYKTFKTEAIIIKEKEFSEADKLFTVFTRRYGRIEILAKSIRKIKAKLQGGLQLLNYLSLEFVKGRSFNIATDAIIKNEFLSLKSSPLKFRAALYVSDLLDKLVKGEEKDDRIWHLLLETLSNLQLTTCNLQLVLRYFEWNLLSYLGFKPELYFCVHCQEKIQKGKVFFSVKDGGVLCQGCKKKYEAKSNKSFKGEITPGIEEISKDAIKILRLIITQNQIILKRLKMTPALLQELKKISKLFLQYIAEEELYVVI